jgi:hypothetical protein
MEHFGTQDVRVTAFLDAAPKTLPQSRGEVAGFLLTLSLTVFFLRLTKACNFPCIDEAWTSVTIGLQTARRL